jgi:hypothetical protein
MGYMQVREIRIADCPRELYKKFYSLNLRRGGSMRRTLKKLRKNKCSTSVIHYVESENKVLAWAMSFPGWKRRYNSYFYVRYINRRQGLGTKLFKTLEKYFVNNNLQFEVYPWDHKSSKFFTKCTKEMVTDSKDSFVRLDSFYYP